MSKKLLNYYRSLNRQQIEDYRARSLFYYGDDLDDEDENEEDKSMPEPFQKPPGSPGEVNLLQVFFFVSMLALFLYNVFWNDAGEFIPYQMLRVNEQKELPQNLKPDVIDLFGS